METIRSTSSDRWFTDHSPNSTAIPMTITTNLPTIMELVPRSLLTVFIKLFHLHDITECPLLAAEDAERHRQYGYSRVTYDQLRDELRNNFFDHFSSEKVLNAPGMKLLRKHFDHALMSLREQRYEEAYHDFEETERSANIAFYGVNPSTSSPAKAFQVKVLAIRIKLLCAFYCEGHGKHGWKSGTPTARERFRMKEQQAVAAALAANSLSHDAGDECDVCRDIECEEEGEFCTEDCIENCQEQEEIIDETEESHYYVEDEKEDCYDEESEEKSMWDSTREEEEEERRRKILDESSGSEFDQLSVYSNISSIGGPMVGFNGSGAFSVPVLSRGRSTGSVASISSLSSFGGGTTTMNSARGSSRRRPGRGTGSKGNGSKVSRRGGSGKHEHSPFASRSGDSETPGTLTGTGNDSGTNTRERRGGGGEKTHLIKRLREIFEMLLVASEVQEALRHECYTGVELPIIDNEGSHAQGRSGSPSFVHGGRSSPATIGGPVSLLSSSTKMVKSVFHSLTKGSSIKRAFRQEILRELASIKYFIHDLVGMRLCHVTLVDHQHLPQGAPEIELLRAKARGMYGHTSGIETLIAAGGRLYSMACDNRICIWDLSPHSPHNSMSSSSRSITGTHVVSSGSGSDAFTCIGMLKNPSNGTFGGSNSLNSGNHDGERVTSMTITPNHKVLFCGSSAGHIAVWDLLSMTQVGVLNGHSRQVSNLTIYHTPSNLQSYTPTTPTHVPRSPSNAMNNSGGRTISRRTSRTIEREESGGSNSGTTVLAKTRNTTPIGGRMLLFSGSWDKEIRVWDVSHSCTGAGYNYPCISVLTGLTGTITSMILLPHRGMLCSGCDDGTIRIWNTNEHEQFAYVATWTHHEGTVSCMLCESGGDDEEDEREDSKSQYNDDDHRGRGGTSTGGTGIGGTGIGGTGKKGEGLLFTGSWDCTIRVWDMEPLACIATLTGHTGYISCMAITTLSPAVTDSILFPPASSVSSKSKKSNNSNKQQYKHLPRSNKRLFSGSNDHTIHIWNLDSYKSIGILTGHNSAIYCMLVDQGKLFSASMNGMIKVWDAESLHCLVTLNAHTEWIRCMTVTDGMLFTGSEDKSIQVHYF